MTSPHIKRRTLLKAASAAGIVWASPVLESVTAHAQGTCTNAQFDGYFSSSPTAEETTNPATDATLEPCTGNLPFCGLAATGVSPCACNAFASGSPAVTGGSWSGSDMSGWTYDPPGDCKVLAANARLYVESTSGTPTCADVYPCVNGVFAPAGPTVSFPPLSSTRSYFKFRMILCC